MRVTNEEMRPKGALTSGWCWCERKEEVREEMIVLGEVCMRWRRRAACLAAMKFAGTIPNSANMGRTGADFGRRQAERMAEAYFLVIKDVN